MNSKQRESHFFTGEMTTSKGVKKQVVACAEVLYCTQSSPVAQDYIFTSEGRPKTLWGFKRGLKFKS